MNLRRTFARWPRCAFLLPAAVAALLLSGCFDSKTTECSGGVICPSGSFCTADGNGCTQTLCGNGTPDDGEECDDGNQIDQDDCRADCKTNFCGDGKVNAQAGAAFEECDDMGVDTASCDRDCTLPKCGDMLTNAAFTAPGAPRGEVCDDGVNGAGVTVSGDGCSADCASDESCGDNYINDDLPNTRANMPTLCLSAVSDGTNCAEFCDDGNMVSGDGCSSNCLSEEMCRNGILDAQGGPGNPPENCDDGDLDDTDECRNNCQSGFGCGNGIVDNDGPAGPQFDEECDNGIVVAGVPQDNGACDGDCTIPVCGDARFNTTTEDCDPGMVGANVPTCNADCTVPACGDGKVNLAFIPSGTTTPEACDDGNTAAGDGCSAICHIETCGNGVTETINGEQCDDTNLNDLDTCRNNCQTPRCGDGVASAAETCDTSGNSGTCDFDCSAPVCGDGVINRMFVVTGVLTEACDDGNTVAGDGCSMTCQIETCGNGVIEMINGEQCDDTNLNDLDTCRNNCQTPRCGDGIASTPPIEICDTSGDSSTCDGNCTLPLCGDGNVNVATNEQCDDGGTVSGDGCSAICRIEPFALTVTKTGTGAGTVTSAPAGIACGGDCTESYAPATVITLTAVVTASSVFTGWSGGGCTGTGTCVVTMDAAKNVVAQFDLNTLTIAKTGTGTGSVASSPAGISCGATCSANFNANQSVTLTATPVANSNFTSWTGGGCTGNGTCVTTMAGAKTITADFTLKTVILTVAKAGNGTVTSVPSGINCGATCTAGFDQDSTVVLSATPTANNTFAGWSGAGCSGTATCVVTMSAAQAVTATFTPNVHQLTVVKAGTGGGTVTSASTGINCGTDCTESYDANTAVVLTAVASTGSTFAGWSGGACTGIGTCSVTVTQATTIIATFTLNSAVLTVAKVGQGTVNSVPMGIGCGATCSAGFPSGSVVGLVASPTAGWAFTSWTGATGCNTNALCFVTVSGAQTVTATFTQLNYTLTVTKTGNGAGSVGSAPAGISCGATCSASFASGMPVVLTATPNANNTFTGWSGAGCSGTGTCSVTMNQAETVSANFAVTAFALTVIPTGSGAGSVVSSPGGIAACTSSGGTCTASFNAGVPVTLTATATAATSVFTGWSGAGCSGTGTCVVTMSQAQTVVANFALASRTLTAVKAGTGSGAIGSAPSGINCPGDCTENYDHGTVVVLTATAGSNAVFSSWTSGPCSGSTSTTCIVTMTAATTVTASFVPEPQMVTLAKTGTGTVIADSGAINCGATCVGSYPFGLNVTFTASGGGTVAWGGAGAGCTGLTCTVTISTGPLTVNADFTP